MGRKENLYLKIYRRLREDITGGLYPKGSKLPSKRSMAEAEGVSVITVEHAYGLLADEGYIVARERSGYYVVYEESSSFPVGGPQEPERYRHGKSDYKSEFPFGVYARTARRVLATYGDELLRLAPNYGCMILRNAISLYLARSRHMYVSPTHILIGSGAEYLYGLIVQVLGRDKVYGIENPSYEKISQVYGASRVKCEMLPLGPDGINSWDLWHSEAQVLHITPYRSFPSGVTASPAKKAEYLRWANERDAYIIEDDFESEFTPAKKPEDTLFSMDENSRVIYVNTFSNSISASLRTAYMIFPEDLHSLFDERIGFYTCTVPTFDQYILAELINNGDFERHINRVRRKRRGLSSRIRSTSR